MVRQTGQRLIIVEISPPLPNYLAGMDSDIVLLLLGLVNSELHVSDIGKRPFMVDIYVAKKTSVCHEYDPRMIERIGCGKLHSEMTEAIKASPLED